MQQITMQNKGNEKREIAMVFLQNYIFGKKIKVLFE